MFFPHFRNRREFYNTILPHLPRKSDYNYNGFKPKHRREFLVWYKKNYRTPFNLNETLAEYCLSDVRILAAGMTEFRKLLLKVSNIDILETSMTMASACLRHFCTNHIKNEHIAIISELGHDVKHNQSEVALKYLKRIEETEGLDIHTYDCYGGEHKVTVEGHTYRLDGYVKNGSTNGRDLAIEVNGCIFHGHFCVGHDLFICPNGNTVEQNRKRTLEREESLRLVMDVRVIYECEIRDQLRKNKEMKQFFENCVVGGPINARDAFKGGRTGPAKLYARYRSGYTIKYRDFVSLYPATIMKGKFPVIHPKLEIINQDVNWTRKEENKYLGLLKVLILPPKDLIHPALPLKADNRLVFPLCRSCTLKFKEGTHTVNGKRVCRCPDNKRALVGTFTHNEINLALENGYIVKKLFRVNKFEEGDFDSKLYTTYVQEFIKTKIESSGFPSDKRTPEERAIWLKENEEEYGIKLDPSNMIKNEGLRWIAKTCLNSLWGRLALRNDLSKTKIIYDPEELNQLHCDNRIEINSIDFLDDDMDYIMVTYSPKEGYVEENPSSNILISLYPPR
ncbi:DNA polymerase type b, organellar and viral domain-containing protein [Ditylenchus destructor]|nr:DNA polymerase type b, organellar and viral domain-containing protein [Ditylenchus destructor]